MTATSIKNLAQRCFQDLYQYAKVSKSLLSTQLQLALSFEFQRSMFHMANLVEAECDHSISSKFLSVKTVKEKCERGVLKILTDFKAAIKRDGIESIFSEDLLFNTGTDFLSLDYVTEMLSKSEDIMVLLQHCAETFMWVMYYILLIQI